MNTGDMLFWVEQGVGQGEIDFIEVQSLALGRISGHLQLESRLEWRYTTCTAASG
ncbi:MAG: hypothetical protein ABI905_18370 [Betaproteobacteria bacterium]